MVDLLYGWYNGTGLVSLFTYGNDVTAGYFGYSIFGLFWLISFITMFFAGRASFQKSFLGSSFVSLIVGGLMNGMGMVGGDVYVFTLICVIVGAFITIRTQQIEV